MQLVGEVGISAPRFAVGWIVEDLLDGGDPAFSHCRFTRGRFVGPRGRRGLCRRSTLDLTRRASWRWVIARLMAIVGVVLGSAATSSGAATGVGTASAGVWTHTALAAVAILIQVVDRKSVFGIELLAVDCIRLVDQLVSVRHHASPSVLSIVPRDTDEKSVQPDPVRASGVWRYPPHRTAHLSPPP